MSEHFDGRDIHLHPRTRTGCPCYDYIFKIPSTLRPRRNRKALSRERSHVVMMITEICIYSTVFPHIGYRGFIVEVKELEH